METIEIAVEIQISQVDYMGREARLVLIRNVNYIVEHSKLQQQASYESKLTNTLSHELLTPLNCIINMSEQMNQEALAQIDDLKEELKSSSPQNAEEINCKIMMQEMGAERLELVWSSGKILELMVMSIISRQKYNTGDNNLLRRQAFSKAQIEESLQEVIKPFRLNM